MSELMTCPRCARTGFYAQGLKTHVCKGARPGEPRRRLTAIELASAREETAACLPSFPITQTRLPNKRRYVTRAMVARMRELARQGLRQREIAERVGATRTAVAHHLSRGKLLAGRDARPARPQVGGAL